MQPKKARTYHRSSYPGKALEMLYDSVLIFKQRVPAAHKLVTMQQLVVQICTRPGFRILLNPCRGDKLVMVDSRQLNPAYQPRVTAAGIEEQGEQRSWRLITMMYNGAWIRSSAVTIRLVRWRSPIMAILRNYKSIEY
jgi:hypothetical protein